jgi:peptide/nickel transport system substrate-binding protein
MKKSTALPFLSILIITCILLTACSPAQPTQPPAANPPANPPAATQAPAQPAAPTQAAPAAPQPTAASPAAAPTAPAAPAASTIKRGGELIFARSEEPLSLDPIVPGDNGSIFTIVQLFDTLVRVGPTGNEIEPDLAKTWDISSDGLTYTFHLREAKFSNGDPVTTQDVVFSLERARSADSAGAFAYDMVDKITATDAQTVTITLKTPSAPFLSGLAYYVAGVVPQKAFTADPKGFSSKPIGSGPFMISSFTRGEDIVLTPNPNYWEMGADGKPLPYLSKITIKYIPENSSRVLGLQNGDFNVIQDVPYNDAKNIESMSGLKLEVAEIFGLQYVYLNETFAPSDNVNFRLALNYATDREAILKNVYFGYGTLPNSCLPRMRYWSKDVPAIPFDLAKAKDALAKSGYKGETLELLVPAGDSTRKQEAVMLQQMWGDAGIKATIKEQDLGATLDFTHKNNSWNTLVLYTTSDINDDDELATLKTGVKYWGSHYNNPDVTALLKTARESTDETVRAQSYAKVQAILYDQDAMCVPFTYTPALSAYQDTVQGWKTLNTGWWWLRNVWINK